MKYICGMTFAPFEGAGRFGSAESKESLALMKERTGADFVIFVPNGLQETAQSEKIDYNSPATMTDEELEAMIDYAGELGLRVALKPTVNCKNGVWRAHISFFEEDVPCEPKWSVWFEAYTQFQLHYAGIAERKGCEMLIAGCEMVMSEHREAEWRRLIGRLREAYSGLISYNTDKYQEHRVKWWDCVDVISSSGYYPLEDWETQLDRIEQVVERYGKPFFFAEAGCMSVTGSSKAPNDWTMEGAVNTREQEAWYEAMLSACQGRSWAGGMAFWSWGSCLYAEGDADSRGDYEIFAKPAEKLVRKYYCKKLS